MKAIPTKLKDCYILEPTKYADSRGYFFESYNQHMFAELTGLQVNFVQDNQSFSTRGVLRGLHAQSGEFAQAKLVRALRGEVIDVAVDARPESPTFGEHIAVRLSALNNLQLFVPRGFLHGFLVLSEEVEFFYKCDNYYNQKSECGVIYNDPALAIDWGDIPHDLIVSDKDKNLPSFNEVFRK